MLTPQQEKELGNRLQEIVCRSCIERGPDGECSLTAMKECPVKLHLPRLVAAASKVDSHLMSDYVEQVRKDVCGVCDYCFTPEDCPPRSEGHCALDAYLLPIVEAVEAFLEEHHLKKASAS